MSDDDWDGRADDIDEDASYVCPSCGEDIVVPVDRTAGDDQEYVEDCPVCCTPVVLRVAWHADGTPSMTAHAE